MEYKYPPSQKTLNEINSTLDFIRQHGKNLIEKEGDSKWTAGHKIFCFEEDEPGFYCFMVGPLKNGKVTWHMMPLYGLNEMKEKWEQDLKPFQSGKSCIQFTQFSDLPKKALQDIVTNGTPKFRKVMEDFKDRKKNKNNKKS